MKIEFTSLTYVDSFLEAIDQVAKERQHLLFVKAPDKSGTEIFIKNIIEKQWTQYLAIENRKVIGWCDISHLEYEGTEHIGHLGMGVIKEFRKKGIGEKLVRKSLEDAFKKGISRIELEVFSSNIPAINLYTKLGFKIEGEKKNTRQLDAITYNTTIMALLKDRVEQA